MYDLALPEIELVAYKVEDLFGVHVLFFHLYHATQFPLEVPDTELQEFVYAGDRFGGIWF